MRTFSTALRSGSPVGSSARPVSRRAGFAAMLAFALVANSAMATQIYVLSGTGEAPGPTTSFGRIDVTTGVYTHITALADPQVMNLAWNPTLSKFYTISADLAEAKGTLKTLDPDGTLTAVSGQLGSDRIVYGMAYRQSDNTLYAYDTDGADSGTIDTSSGLWSTLNPASGVPDSPPRGGRYTLHNDTIYIAGSSLGTGRFGSIGFTSTSNFSQIGSDDAAFMTMVLASDGLSLYGIFGSGTNGSQALYGINPATGAATFDKALAGTGLGTYFYGAAVGPSSSGVPEIDPAGIGSVLALVTGALGLLERWRMKAKAT